MYVLVAALLFGEEDSRRHAMSELESRWGPVTCASELIPFGFTEYYRKEMGRDLKRQFIAFERLSSPGALAGIKISSNTLEVKLSRSGRRTVNIDPGHLGLSKLVVASTKDATYRVYLGGGIYAQPMLRYERGSYRPWPWTYPDYRIDEAVDFFNGVREKNSQKLLRRAPTRR